MNELSEEAVTAVFEALLGIEDLSGDENFAVGNRVEIVDAPPLPGREKVIGQTGIVTGVAGYIELELENPVELAGDTLTEIVMRPAELKVLD